MVPTYQKIARHHQVLALPEGVLSIFYGFLLGIQHTVLSDPESYMAWQDRYNKDHKQPVQKASRMLLTVGEMRVACGKLREYELGRSPPNSKDSKSINIYV